MPEGVRTIPVPSSWPRCGPTEVMSTVAWSTWEATTPTDVPEPLVAEEIPVTLVGGARCVATWAGWWVTTSAMAAPPAPATRAVATNEAVRTSRLERPPGSTSLPALGGTYGGGGGGGGGGGVKRASVSFVAEPLAPVCNRSCPGPGRLSCPVSCRIILKRP